MSGHVSCSVCPDLRAALEWPLSNIRVHLESNEDSLHRGSFSGEKQLCLAPLWSEQIANHCSTRSCQFSHHKSRRLLQDLLVYGSLWLPQGPEQQNPFQSFGFSSLEERAEQQILFRNTSSPCNEHPSLSSGWTFLCQRMPLLHLRTRSLLNDRLAASNLFSMSYAPVIIMMQHCELAPDLPVQRFLAAWPQARTGTELKFHALSAPRTHHLGKQRSDAPHPNTNAAEAEAPSSTAKSSDAWTEPASKNAACDQSKGLKKLKTGCSVRQTPKGKVVVRNLNYPGSLESHQAQGSHCSFGADSRGSFSSLAKGCLGEFRGTFGDVRHSMGSSHLCQDAEVSAGPRAAADSAASSGAPPRLNFKESM